MIIYTQHLYNHTKNYLYAGIALSAFQIRIVHLNIGSMKLNRTLCAGKSLFRIQCFVLCIHDGLKKINIGVTFVNISILIQLFSLRQNLQPRAKAPQ